MICVFLQKKIQQRIVQEHIFGEFMFAHLTFGSCTSPTDTSPFTYHPFNNCSMCAVENSQRLIFGNSQSSNKFAGNPKIVSHPTSSQEILKQKSIFTFKLRSIYGVNGTEQYLLDTENTLLGQLFLPCYMYDSYKAFFYDDKTYPEKVATTSLNSTDTRFHTTD